MSVTRLLTGIAALSILAVAAAAYAAPVVHKIPAAPAPAANPLKGLVAYAGELSFPHSLEWFYLPVNAVETGDNQYDWTALEAKLNDVASRGDQACLRFYYDYPTEQTGVPKFLLTGKDQLQLRPYTDYGGGMSPDYNGANPGSARFRQSMQEFIAAFGAKYDGDPRIGFITVGLLGFWGEWHTYPHEDWTPTDDVMNMVLTSYTQAFHKTRLEVRYPLANAPKLPVGFHDDAFCDDTLYAHDWDFAARLRAAQIDNVWQRESIGGEVMPDLQASVFTKNPSGLKWVDCVKAVHATWMLCNEIKRYTGDTRATAIDATTHMGYNFRVTTATFGDIHHAKPLTLKVDIDNDGIAPFYYRWNVEVGVKRAGSIVKTWTTDWDITKIPAAGSHAFSFDAVHPGLKSGTYTLAIKVINPMHAGKPLLFANQGQNADGWLDLGTFRAP